MVFLFGVGKEKQRVGVDLDLILIAVVPLCPVRNDPMSSQWNDDNGNLLKGHSTELSRQLPLCLSTWCHCGDLRASLLWGWVVEDRGDVHLSKTISFWQFLLYWMSLNKDKCGLKKDVGPFQSLYFVYYIQNLLPVKNKTYLQSFCLHRKKDTAPPLGNQVHGFSPWKK